RLKWQKQLGLNGVKTSALRRWLVSLGLIALEQTTRFTGGHDCNKLKVYNRLGDNFENRCSNNGKWFVQENEI
ncbi:hypothetical protein B9N51_03085, partial [Finegoldia magna]